MKRKIHREDILSAGLELMFLNGYNATGIKDITNKVGIPKGSFYNHFSSKEDFGLEVVKTYCDGGAAMYENRFINSELPPIKRFELFFDDLISAYETDMNYKLGCVMSNFSAEMADVNERFRELLDGEFSRLQEIMEACISQAQENGAVNNDRKAKELAEFVLNGWHGALIRMKTTGTSEPLKNFKTLVLSRILI